MAITTRFESSTNSVKLASAYAGRRGLLIFNSSTQNLFIKLGTRASSTDFSVMVLAGGYWEMPFPIETCQIDGAWDGVNGYAYVTEW